MRDRSELDTSELTIQITKLIRYITPDGHTYTADTGAPHNNSSEYQRIKNLFHLDSDELIGGPFHGVNGVTDPGFVENQISRSREKRWDSGEVKTWYARVQANAQCGVASGSGEFLIAARRKLGTLSLACAPRMSDWNSLVKKINEEGTAHCLLTT